MNWIIRDRQAQNNKNKEFKIWKYKNNQFNNWIYYLRKMKLRPRFQLMKIHLDQENRVWIQNNICHHYWQPNPNNKSKINISMNWFWPIIKFNLNMNTKAKNFMVKLWAQTKNNQILAKKVEIYWQCLCWTPIIIIYLHQEFHLIEIWGQNYFKNV